MTCPFRAIALGVPRTGRILDVGCGHGLLALSLALASPTRQVRGIDVDERKIRRAQTAAERARLQSMDIAFTLAVPGEMPPGPWDCILIVDVLYLLPPDAQRALLHSCAAQLAPDGVLIVKEMAPDPKWKLAWNTIQETISVRLLRITRGRPLCPLSPDQHAAWMSEAGLAVHHQPLHRGYLHPHHLLKGCARAPGGP